jgi:hypothetical protein
MATTTFTPAAASYIPKADHRGVTVVTFFKTATASAVWGKVLIAKIPHGATVLDGILYNSQSLLDLRVGIGTTSASNKAMFIGTSSALTVTRFYVGSTVPAIGPYKVSVSDAAANRWQMVTMAASASLSGIFSGWISYTMNP